ncbi:MAG: type II secretion system protein GspG [Actinomycetota bacterium]
MGIFLKTSKTDADRRIKQNRGFTLVELMVVVLIVAVLIGISVPAYLIFRERAREASTKSEMKSIVIAIEMYRNDYSVYPSQENFPHDINNYFGAQAPEADFWNTPYVYDSDGDKYLLRSNGKDRQEGTADDIVFENGVMTFTGAYGN